MRAQLARPFEAACGPSPGDTMWLVLGFSPCSQKTPPRGWILNPPVGFTSPQPTGFVGFLSDYKPIQKGLVL